MSQHAKDHGSSESEKSKLGNDKSNDVSDESGIIVKITDFDQDLHPQFFKRPQNIGTRFKMRDARDRKGNRVAIKWLRENHNCCYSGHLENLLAASHKTASVIFGFLKKVNLRGWTIRAVQPKLFSGPNKIPVEPYLQNVQKFNSNSFWGTDSSETYHQLVLALNHFSYIPSSGKFVITKLEGGVDEDARVVTLLPAALNTDTKRWYGCLDLGNANKFLKYHICNSICDEIFNTGHKGSVSVRHRV